jgi:hypothetical protein
MNPIRGRANRRLVIAGTASIVAAGTLATAPTSSVPLAAASDMLELLRTIELAQIERYTAALDRFDARAFTDAGLPGTARSGIEAVLAAEQAHVAALAGTTQPSRQPPALILESAILLDVLSGIADLENLATAAYAGVIPRIDKRRLVEELLGIHSVEARQAAWIASLLGRDPFPDAIDPALAPDDVRSRLTALAGDASPGATPQAVNGEAAVLAAIARELGVAPEAVSIVSLEPVAWPDSALGCPQPGEVYLDVITPGYRVVVDIDGQEYELHADERGNVVRCP